MGTIFFMILSVPLFAFLFFLFINSTMKRAQEAKKKKNVGRAFKFKDQMLGNYSSQ